MQASVSRTKSRRQSVSSKKTTKGKTARKESVLERQSGRGVDSLSVRRNSTKRVLKDKSQKERAVRFRSTDEEYVFEVDTFKYSDVPEGSDVYQTILKEMKDNFDQGKDNDVDDEVFDGVFTATVTLDRTEKKFTARKPSGPGKSILKRRSSIRR